MRPLIFLCFLALTVATPASSKVFSSKEDDRSASSFSLPYQQASHLAKLFINNQDVLSEFLNILNNEKKEILVQNIIEQIKKNSFNKKDIQKLTTEIIHTYPELVASIFQKIMVQKQEEEEKKWKKDVLSLLHQDPSKLSLKGSIVLGKGELQEDKDPVAAYAFVTLGCGHCQELIKDLSNFQDDRTVLFFIAPPMEKNDFVKAMSLATKAILCAQKYGEGASQRKEFARKMLELFNEKQDKLQWSHIEQLAHSIGWSKEIIQGIQTFIQDPSLDHHLEEVRSLSQELKLSGYPALVYREGPELFNIHMGRPSEEVLKKMTSFE